MNEKSTIEEVMKQLHNTGKAVVRNVGTFTRVITPARSGIAPNGKHFDTPSKVTMRFKPSKLLRL